MLYRFYSKQDQIHYAFELEEEVNDAIWWKSYRDFTTGNAPWKV